jgi:hypothetical protein
VLSTVGTVAPSATLGRVTSGRLGVGEFAFPGPLPDQLVAVILAGAKTTTSGLLIGYEHDAAVSVKSNETSGHLRALR